MHWIFLFLYVTIWVPSLIGAVMLGHFLTTRTWQQARRAKDQLQFECQEIVQTEKTKGRQ